MHPVLLAWLTRLLWTPKPTRQILALPRSIADRVEPSLEALTAQTPPDIAGEILDEARAALRSGLSERHISEELYALEFGPDPVATTRVVRSLDGRFWTLREFGDFIDLGLRPQGSSSSGDHDRRRG